MGYERRTNKWEVLAIPFVSNFCWTQWIDFISFVDGVICPGIRDVVNGFFLLWDFECFRWCLTNFTAVKQAAISEHNIHWIPQQQHATFVVLLVYNPDETLEW